MARPARPDRAPAGPGLVPLFTLDSVETESLSVRIRAADTTARLGLVLEAGLTPSGLVRMRATARNDEPDRLTRSTA